ncbi:hypothetical protein SAMN05446635_8246 [Burkholderia sp. OK233]|nr:hypothetical protein SAMN05446635_8246 [Burkholderia sp. OK233]
MAKDQAEIVNLAISVVLSRISARTVIQSGLTIMLQIKSIKKALRENYPLYRPVNVNQADEIRYKE